MALSPNVIAALNIMYTGSGVSASDLNWWATDGANIGYGEAVLLFAQSPQAKAKYPFLEAPQTANKRQYIAQVFANLYNIDINDTSLVPPAELAYWENWLSGTTSGVSNYLLFPDALNNASAAAGLTDRIDALVNKSDISLSLSETLSSVGVNTFTDEQQAAADAIIAGVDATPGSVTAAQAQVVQLAASVNVFTIDEAKAASPLPDLYTISDTADNLIEDSTEDVVVDATNVLANQSPAAPLNLEDANTLLETIDGVAPGVTFAWDILDSADAILGAASETAVTGAASVGITDTSVDIAKAQDLSLLLNFDGTYAIEDTSTAILGNTAIAGDATSITLSNPDVPVSVAQATILQGLNVPVGPSYIVEDTSTDILGAIGTPAIDNAAQVIVSNTDDPLTVAQAESLLDLPNLDRDFTYILADILDNLSGAPSSLLAGAVSYSLTNTSSDLGVITQAEADVVNGATNGASFNFLVADIQLTPQADIVSGNSFLSVAVVEGGSIFNTLNSNDRLTGTGENSTLSLTWQEATFGNINTLFPVLDGIETLAATLIENDLTLVSNNFQVVGQGFITGLKNIEASGSKGGDLELINLQTALETVSVTNYFFGDDVSFSIADPELAGDNDVLDLTVDQVTQTGDATSINISDFSGNGGYETVGLTSGATTSSKGNTNTVDIEGVAALESLAITGNENLDLSTTSLIESVVKVDATGSALIPEFEGRSVFTGDLTAEVTTDGGDMTFLSGDGNDDIKIGRNAKEAGHTLTGGAGNDALDVSGDALGTTNVGHNVWGQAGEDTITVSGDAIGTGNVGHQIFAAEPIVDPLPYVDAGGTITVSGNATGDSAGHVVFGGAGEDGILISGDATGESEGGHDVFAGDDDDTVRITGNSFTSDNVSGSGHSVEGGAGDDLIEISGDALTADPQAESIDNPFRDNSRPFTPNILLPADQPVPTTEEQYQALLFQLGLPDTANPRLFIRGVQNISGAHTVRGGEDNDVILFGPITDEPGNGDGQHLAFGDEGDDFIEMTGIGSVEFKGGAGEDTLIGGDGDPILGFGNDILNGDEGDDFLFGGKGNDTLQGGEDDDIMSGGEGDDFFIVDAGFDVIEDLGDANSVTGDQFQVSEDAEAEIRVVQNWVATNLTFNLGMATLTIENPGGGLVDLSAANTSPPTGTTTNGYTVSGNIGPDAIIGSRDNDTIDGGRGNDSIAALGGNDIIEGGVGNDTIDGGSGNDEINAGAGDDIAAGDLFQVAAAPFLANGGDDSIDGATGSNTLAGDWQISQIDGLADPTYFFNQLGTVLGGDDDLAVTDSIGNNRLVGDLSVSVDDWIIASSGDVSFTNLSMTGGDDSLSGANGSDTLVGDLSVEGGVFTWVTLDGLDLGSFDFDAFTRVAGNDTLEGGSGNDRLVGDLFVEVDAGGANIFTGGIGGTTLVGGDDTLKGGDGDDFLAGDFVLSRNGVVVNGVVLNTLGQLPELSDFLADPIANPNFVIGGNDFLESGRGNDKYYGGGGVDTIALGNSAVGVGPNGFNEVWYLNGAKENAARNGANVDIITGFNVINDKFVFSAGQNNFLNGNGIAGDPNEFLDLQVGAQFDLTLFNNVTLSSNDLNGVFTAIEDGGGIGRSVSAGILPPNANGLVRMAQVNVANNVANGDFAGRQFLFINNGIRDISSQDDFLVEITGISGVFGTDLTPSFEVRNPGNFTV